MTRWIAMCAFALLLPALGRAQGETPASSGAEDHETQVAMDDIVANLEIVFPLSLSDGRFSDPAERGRVETALASLAAASRRLEQHGQGEDVPFAFLSGVLARDLRDVERRYRAGKERQARFMLQSTIETCVSCHSRLPAERAPELGARFLSKVDLASLSLDERARLEAATRQFDAALATYESLFASPEYAPADADLLGAFVDYLEICVRVQRDYDRALGTFRRVAARPDLSESLRADVAAWIASLEQMKREPPAGDSLPAARALVERAQSEAEWYDAKALVPYVAASGNLYRALAKGDLAPPERAEALYLLGVIESRIGRSAWLSEAEPYLEASIRTAPGSPVARPAYALLKELLVGGYTGSGGTHVPRDVRQLLDELEERIDRAQPSQSPPS